jgi:hypothetical protein
MTIEQLNKQITEGKIRNCSQCKQALPVSMFHIIGKKNKNHARFQSPCKKCANANRDIEYRKIAQRKKKYNMSTEDYYTKLNLQNNCCDICNISIIDYGKEFTIDHCHITNKIRGLLCNTCNSGIGMLKENELILEKAIKYLKKWQN